MPETVVGPGRKWQTAGQAQISGLVRNKGGDGHGRRKPGTSEWMLSGEECSTENRGCTPQRKPLSKGTLKATKETIQSKYVTPMKLHLQNNTASVDMKH